MTRRVRVIAGALLLLAVAAAWSNSWSVPFLFDDLPSIVDNPSLRSASPADWLRPPATAGETVSGRPLLNLSFAINYAGHGLDVRGYHVGNLIVHLAAALLLFGIVRRTGAADGFAFVVALVWALHPLQTAAVTYVVQRAESLAGLFYLLTLYGFIRAAEPGAPRVRWAVLSVVACLLGVGTKETVATAPILVLLYDRTFISGSFRAAWRAHARLHAALAASWLLLVVLVLANQGRGGSAGLDAPIGPWSYLLTQAEAIPHYLALAFWPVSQVFDYGTPVAAGMVDVLPQILLLACLAAGTVWGLWRNRVTGFLGAWFFLTLAPSSSLVPVATQTMAEHRMYLALAAVVGLMAMAVSRVLRRQPAWTKGLAAAAVAVALCAMTYARNSVYQSELTLWQDTVAKRPDNPRARNNLGQALMAQDRVDDAMAEFRQALALQPSHAFAHANLGVLLLQRQQFDAARHHFQAAVTADPTFVSARVNLGHALAELGQTEAAVEHYRAILALAPDAHDARTNLAGLLVQQGNVDEAMGHLRTALSAAPDLPEAHYHLGLALERTGSLTAAVNELRTAVRLRPGFASAHLALGNLLARGGDAPRAEAALRAAVAADARQPEAHYALGNVLARQQRFEEALVHYQQALDLAPDHVAARNNLANAQLVTGRFREAIETYEAVLQLRPGDPAVQRNLDVAREAWRSRGADRP